MQSVAYIEANEEQFLPACLPSFEGKTLKTSLPPRDRHFCSSVPAPLSQSPEDCGTEDAVWLNWTPSALEEQNAWNPGGCFFLGLCLCNLSYWTGLDSLSVSHPGSAGWGSTFPPPFRFKNVYDRWFQFMSVIVSLEAKNYPRSVRLELGPYFGLQ